MTVKATGRFAVCGQNVVFEDFFVKSIVRGSSRQSNNYELHRAKLPEVIPPRD